MKNLKKKRVLLITNMIAPYRIPLFKAISERGNFYFKVIGNYLKIELNLITRFYQAGIGLFGGKRKRFQFI